MMAVIPRIRQLPGMRRMMALETNGSFAFL
jgi:hypothetical protein